MENYWKTLLGTAYAQKASPHINTSFMPWNPRDHRSSQVFVVRSFGNLHPAYTFVVRSGGINDPAMLFVTGYSGVLDLREVLPWDPKGS